MSKEKTAVVEKKEKPRESFDTFTPDNPNGGMFETYNQPIFEAELMAAGKTIIDAFTKGIFKDTQELLDACLYIGLLKRIKCEARIPMALVKINGTMSIGGRARNDAIQAHGGLYFPPNATKDEKKYLAEMQQGNRRRDDNDRR